MADKTLWVKGVEGCSGLWGALADGEVRALPADIAESLVRGGLAVRTDKDGHPLPVKPAPGAVKKSTPAAAS